MPFKRLRMTLEMIKFEHSVFALPFALTGALLAFREGRYTPVSVGRTLLWIAVRGSLDPRILWLTAAVTCWTAGFDVIYSCQDYEFDRAEGLFSVPRVLGIAGALRVAQLLHVAMVGCLVALVWSLQLGGLAVAGIVAVVALLL